MHRCFLARAVPVQLHASRCGAVVLWCCVQRAKVAAVVRRLEAAGLVGDASPNGVLQAECIRVSSTTGSYVIRFRGVHSWVKLVRGPRGVAVCVRT